MVRSTQFARSEMQIDCDPRCGRNYFGGVCFVFMALFLAEGLRAYLAARLAAKPDLANIQRASQLEPSNAEYRELLARNLALSGASLEKHFQTIGWRCT